MMSIKYLPLADKTDCLKSGSAKDNRMKFDVFEKDVPSAAIFTLIGIELSTLLELSSSICCTYKMYVKMGSLETVLAGQL